MAEVIHPEEQMIETPIDNLMEKALEMKHKGARLSQACAAYVNDKFELFYSFANDETYEYDTLHFVIDTDQEVPSITEIFPAAVFYENEMMEIFGVKMRMINLDLHNRFYRIEAVQPLGPEVKEEEPAPEPEEASPEAEEKTAEEKPAEEAAEASEKEEA